MTRPPFPKAIDSSMMATFRSCPRKFELEYLQHWKTQIPSVHLHAGAAYAKGLETTRRAFWEDGYTPEDSIAMGLGALMQAYGDFECPSDSAKSMERMCGALEFHFQNYPLGENDVEPILLANGKRAIEFSFAEPLEIKHPETGEPLIYCGRSDMIGTFAGGNYILDDKTTTSLGASWSKQWDMRSQFTGYTWAAKKLNQFEINGILVRGISVLKTKYETQQPITARADWEIQRWFDQTMRDIRRMIAMWEEGYFDYNLDHSCGEYGGCLFLQPCKSPDPQPWLEMYYARRVWNPLSREEEEAPAL